MREINFTNQNEMVRIIDGNCIMCPTREKQEEKDSCKDAILEWLKGDAE